MSSLRWAPLIDLWIPMIWIIEIDGRDSHVIGITQGIEFGRPWHPKTCRNVTNSNDLSKLWSIGMDQLHLPMLVGYIGECVIS